MAIEDPNHVRDGLNMLESGPVVRATKPYSSEVSSCFLWSRYIEAPTVVGRNLVCLRGLILHAPQVMIWEFII